MTDRQAKGGGGGGDEGEDYDLEPLETPGGIRRRPLCYISCSLSDLYNSQFTQFLFYFCPSVAHLGVSVDLCHVSRELRDVRSQKRKGIKGDYRFSTEGEGDEKKRSSVCTPSPCTTFLVSVIIIVVE